MHISGIKNSIRWRFIIIYFIMISVVLAITAVITTQVIQSTLLDKKISEGMEQAYDYSVKASDDLYRKDAAALYDSAVLEARQNGSRVIITDNAGIVQVDSLGKMNAQKLNSREVLEVLAGLSDSSYGFHRIKTQNEGEFWSAYYVSAVINNSEVIGTVVLSQSLDDVNQNIKAIAGQVIAFFLITLILVFVLSYFMTSRITKPIDDLKDAAIKISEGDFTVRVKPQGSSELAELTRVFNTMTERIENTDRQRTEFISNASHELKTPMTSMKILAETLLSEENVPPEIYRDFLSDINAEMDRLSALVKDLLLITKLENGNATLVFEHSDVTEMCRRTVRMLKPLAEKKNISLTCETNEKIEAYCSASTIYEAISNLTENAIKYTQDGGSVKITAGYYKNKYVKISVEDTGEGISKENQKHLFERFYRVDKARSRATGGTGLGLHIVYQIAKAHGGTVNVESEPGVGSVFTLKILKSREEM